MTPAGDASELRAAVRALEPQLVRWRRELHQHPELAFEEHRTAEFVARQLDGLGLEVRREVGGTGVLGVLRAARRDRPAVLLRADLDALPVHEVAGREYGSRVPGKMHACGHDGHMAMLLGAATLVAERRASLVQDVVFCFQPAEETGGGAARMLDAGILEAAEVGAVYALHLWSPHDVGTIAVRPGPMMAGADEFRARIVGRGGHGALPHEARDPIVAAALCIAALQAVVARTVDPLDAVVLTVGAVHAGEAANVIPDVAELAGTLRSFREPLRQALRERVRAVLEGVSTGMGCRAEVEFLPGCPAVVNDPAAVAVVRRLAAQVVGSERVHEPPPLGAAEDFAWFLERRPGAFVFVGAGNRARGIDAPHHSPRFDIDEAALSVGAELLARLAFEDGHPRGVVGGQVEPDR